MYLRIRNLIRRAVLSAADHVAPLTAAGLAIAREPRRRVGLFISGGVLGLVLAVALVAWVLGPERAGDAKDAEAWRYLVVCDACGQRQRVLTPPDPRGAPRCERCGRGRLTSYRRGSQALIPGGWSTSQPGAATHAAEDGS